MMRRAGIKTYFLTALILGLSTSINAAGLADSADAILLNMLGTMSTVNDYEARLIVQSKVAGRMRAPEEIFIKQRREPSCTYMQWLDGPRQSAERVFCSDTPDESGPVRQRGRTLMNSKALTRAQMEALQIVLRPVDDDGLYGMVARYANLYFDAAENARPGDFIVELRPAVVFNNPSSCVRIRRRNPIPDVPFQGQSEICVDDQTKMPSTFRNWDVQGELLEAYLIGDFQINRGLIDADFELKNQVTPE